MGWADAIAGAFKAFTEVFTWRTGGRTHDENSLREQVERWNEEYNKALSAGDVVRTNRAFTELRRVRDEARSKS